MERDKELYERQIKIVDTQIDRLVYDLYGLTEEIGIVEKNAIVWQSIVKIYVKGLHIIGYM